MRGAVRSFELQDPFAWKGSLGGEAFRAAQQATAASTRLVSLPTLRFALGHTHPQIEEEVATVARTWVKVPADVTTTLLLRWDDRIVIHYDGALVFTGNVTRGLTEPPQTARFVLKAGWRPLVAELSNVKGPWGFALRLRDAHGVPFEKGKIEIEARPPR